MAVPTIGSDPDMDDIRQFEDWQAYFGILVDPLTNGLNQYYIVTIVHYLHWTGPVYFNLIRPFHRLVVARMARAAARNSKK